MVVYVMIKGIGVDIVEVDRIQKALVRYGDRFAQKILSVSEYGEYQVAIMKAAFVAKRFAMKEAFVKALGTGMRDGIFFTDIAVTHDALGKPFIEVGSSFQHWILGNDVHVSVSDEKNTVVAFVVIEHRP